MGTFVGIVLIVLITLIAGLIAYIGDRVGHQVGRRRMTMFGLRPKHTSTIVAVGTGMLIALAVTISAISASYYVRAAFFHLEDINNKVNELQAQADALEHHVRESNVVVNRGDLLYDQFLLMEPQWTTEQRMRNLSTFFDAVVASLNRRYVPLGLKPYRLTSSDTEIAKKLQAVLADQRVQSFLVRGPVMLVAVADYNLFVNDPLQFTFAPYADEQIFSASQKIAQIEVDGGTSVVPTVAYTELIGAVQDVAIAKGMPAFFARALPRLTDAEVQDMRSTIKAGEGRFYIVARASRDVYPHTGGVPVDFELTRNPD
ncbi:MAG: DUF3084 domain-containing protein [Candidatus Baltobacteraceae bacterium]